MRLDVLDALESLGDAEHQRNAWGVAGEGNRTYDDFTLNVHLLYDDTTVLPDPRSRVGEILLPEDVAPLERLGARLGPLLTRLGNSPDAEYLSDPSWPAVVEAAKEAYSSLETRGDTGRWRAERSKKTDPIA
jgi:hypothetical protein